MVILGSMLALVAIAIAGPVTAVRAQEEAPDGVVNYTRIDATVARELPRRRRWRA